jgi:hypothetical protein
MWQWYESTPVADIAVNVGQEHDDAVRVADALEHRFQNDVALVHIAPSLDAEELQMRPKVPRLTRPYRTVHLAVHRPSV